MPINGYSISDDEGSDMDVSSDEGVMVSTYPTLPHEQLVQSLRNHINFTESLNQPIAPSTQTFMPISYAPPHTTSYSSVAIMPVDDGCDSDSSYHTAPDSPLDSMDLNDDKTSASNLKKSFQELQEEYDMLIQQQVQNERNKDRITKEIERQKEPLDILNLRILELNVRMSIKKNKKKVTSPTSSTPQSTTESLEITNPTPSHVKEKGKERVVENTVAPIIPLREDSPTRQLREAVDEMLSYRKSDVVSKVKKTNKQKLRVAYPPDPSHFPDPVITRRSKPSKEKNLSQLRKDVKRTFPRGHVSLRQMRIQLCDLFLHYKSSAMLTIYQQANVCELLKKIYTHWKADDDHIPSAPDNKNRRMVKQVKPMNSLLLPHEFYGSPDTLNYETFPLTTSLLKNAVRCFSSIGNSKQICMPQDVKEALDEPISPNEAELVALKEATTRETDVPSVPPSDNINSIDSAYDGADVRPTTDNLYQELKRKHTSQNKPAPYTIPSRPSSTIPVRTGIIRTPVNSFKPYASPLRSLGLSNRAPISVKTPRNPMYDKLCDAESNGGICNDLKCPFTHFADFQ